MEMPAVLRRLLPSRLAARLMLLVCFTAALSAAIAATSMLIWPPVSTSSK